MGYTLDSKVLNGLNDSVTIVLCSEMEELVMMLIMRMRMTVTPVIKSIYKTPRVPRLRVDAKNAVQTICAYEQPTSIYS